MPSNNQHELIGVISNRHLIYPAVHKVWNKLDKCKLPNCQLNTVAAGGKASTAYQLTSPDIPT